MNEPVDNGPVPEAVIAAADAVFWMDGRGRWCNRHGPFRNPKIIEHFHRSIRRDADGYFVTQLRGGVREKVYFRYDRTPLFAVDLRMPEKRLLLNTREQIALGPDSLFVEDDALFMKRGTEIVRFSERAMVQLSPFMEEAAGGLTLVWEGRKHRIPETGPSGTASPAGP